MEFTVRPFQPGEEAYVADAHRRVYSEEYRWGEPFIRYATRIPLAFAQRERSEREELWIAEADGKPVGSIMLCETEDPAAGQLRLFLVEKDYRRYGIGDALLHTLMDKARSSGYKKLILETAAPLSTAIRKYERLGFHVTKESVNNDWSIDGTPVTEFEMEMEL